ncbi:MAG: RluA family pseudouridine synthase [Thiomicrospira sp.]|uniref:RluA family pseudouridine synthase n=1 Tax=Thiomicrospira sp. TaxID=935 RepID=UPI0019DBF3B7|nr:RluA family pseudouridine synthase [Thiomicrospira sp.]MBE0494024.1 RluA family pseudouridine synthase [Thiomicrospira sp.]
MNKTPTSTDWILYADEQLIVINKPSGLLSVPGKSEQNKECVLTHLHQTHPEALIVHRLDMDTSGIMVLAMNKQAHRSLSIQFQDRKVNKKYYALCAGKLLSNTGYVQLPMRCDWDRRPKQIIDFIHGRSAQTHWQIMTQYENHFSVELSPITGRSHQLRLHMKSLGHPILGDNLYADHASIANYSRLMLHAGELEFSHPETQQRLKITSTPEFL